MARQSGRRVDTPVKVRLGDLLVEMHAAYCYGVIVSAGSGPDEPIPFMAPKGESLEVDAFVRAYAKSVESQRRRKDGTRAVPGFCDVAEKVLADLPTMVEKE